MTNPAPLHTHPRITSTQPTLHTHTHQRIFEEQMRKIKPEVVRCITESWQHDPHRRLSINSVVEHIDRALAIAIGVSLKSQGPVRIISAHVLFSGFSARLFCFLASPRDLSSFWICARQKDYYKMTLKNSLQPLAPMSNIHSQPPTPSLIPSITPSHRSSGKISRTSAFYPLPAQSCGMLEFVLNSIFTLQIHLLPFGYP